MWEWPRKPLTHDLAYTPYPSYHCNTTHSKHCYTVSVIPTPFLGPSIPYRLQVPLLSGSHAAIQTQLQAPSNFLSFEQGRGATPPGQKDTSAHKWARSQIKSSFGMQLWKNFNRPTSHIFSNSSAYNQAVQFPLSSDNVVSDPIKVLLEKPYKAHREVKFKPQTLCNPQKARGRAPHLFILFFCRHKIFVYFVSHLLGGRVKVMRNTRQLFLNYLLTRRGWLRIVSSIIRPAIHFLGPH